MAERIAKTHTHNSNRVDRKVVFKNAVDNPFRIRWPSVHANVQKAVLERVISSLDGVPELKRKDLDNRKRKRASTSPSESKDGIRKKRKVAPTEVDAIGFGDPVDGLTVCSSLQADESRDSLSAKLRHFTIGINEVTKRLESQIKVSRGTVSISSKIDPVDFSCPLPTISIVLVCRADVEPPLLIRHLPHLVAAYNSSIITRPSNLPKEPIKLITLPKDAEFMLAKALGLRRAAVVAINQDAPDLASLAPSLQSVPTLTAPWLISREPIPTHIKQFRTSAPKDMKAAKMQRIKARFEARRKMKEKVKGSTKRTHVVVSS